MASTKNSKETETRLTVEKKTKPKAKKGKKETTSLKIVSVGGEDSTASVDGTTKAVISAAPVKTLDAKYGKQVSTRQSKSHHLLAEVDQFASRAESSIESFLFTYETHEKTDDANNDSLVTIETGKNQLASGLTFSEGGESGRRLTFEKDSLALRALQDGKVDFADDRVQVQAAKVDLKMKAYGKTILEVDLGDVQSLQGNEVHMRELQKQNLVKKGDVVVDDATNTDDAAKYRLVMVGRRVSAEEQSKDRYLESVLGDTEHGISQEVYHESGEQFSQAILKDEGLFKYYLRHSYMAIGLLFGIWATIQAYQESTRFALVYEDYLDGVVFQQAKLGRPPSQLARILYCSDQYSVENRQN